MVFYTGLARLARDAGLVVREVNGWKSRTLGTRPNGMAGVRGCLWHHTATSASAVKSRNNPTLNYLVSGLGYPSASFGLAWDGSIDVIAAGAAAHAGKGRYGSRIPRDRGNDYLFGVEVEGTTGLTWSNAQLESAARLGHAMNKEWGSSFLQIGHLEYAPTRKVDPSGIPGGMPALRKAIARGYWKDKNWKPGGKVSTGSAGSSGGSSKPAVKRNETLVDKVMETKRKNVKVYAANSTSSKVIGTMSGKGYDVHVVKTRGKSRSWAQIKWQGGTGWVVAKYLRDLPKGSTSSSKSSSKAWPHKKLKVTSKHTTASHRAYVKMLAGVGFKDKSLTTAIQKWLRWNGYYKASDGFVIDGDMGRLTVQELQKFLKAQGFYKGVIDGGRGPMTVKAEIAYLNDQAKHYK